MKCKDVMSKEYIEGLKSGLKIAQDILKREGYDFTFPDIDSFEIEKIKETKLK